MVCLPGSPHLVQTAASEVVGDDDVGDGVEDELDVLRVGGAPKMYIISTSLFIK